MDITRNDITDHLAGFERHLRVLKGLQATSVNRYRAHISEFIAWRAGNAQEGSWADVTTRDIESYLEWCWNRGNANTTRLTKLTALQGFCRYLIYSGELAEDPTENIPKPAADSAALIPFTRAEVHGLFGAIDPTTEKGIRDIVFIILGTFAGLRVSEIYSCNIEDVLDGEQMDISIPKTKKKAQRTVWLWKAPAIYLRMLFLARLSQGARAGDPLLVSYKKDGAPRGNRRLTHCACDRLLKKLADRAGIRKVRIKTHMLRTTHANDLRHVRGYDPFAIMQRMGWKNVETATRYISRREPVHKVYNNLHEYWSGFNKVWNTKEGTDALNRNAEIPGGPAGV